MHASICDFALDIVQNSHEAGAGLIELDIAESLPWLEVRVRDDGCGMDAEQLRRALDPFANSGKKHRSRRVGLGLPFLIQGLEQSGGRHRIESERGRGTLVEFAFDLSNVDCPPLGDVRGLLLTVLCMQGGYELVVRRAKGDQEYRLRRSELIEAIGGLDTAASIAMLREYIASQECGGL